MRLGRRQILFGIIPLGLLVLLLLFPRASSQDQIIVWMHGNNQGGGFSWQGMPDPVGQNSHTLYLRLSDPRHLFFRMPPRQGVHGISLLPGAPHSDWQDSDLHDNRGHNDWVYPKQGWRAKRPGSYTFYCPAHQKMWIRVEVLRGKDKDPLGQTPG